MAHKAECTPMDRWLDVVGGGAAPQPHANADGAAAAPAP
jgi:hypothetical protein